MGLYEENKAAKVKSEIECPVCHCRFIKKQWQQVFCSDKCKNKFWNKKGDRHKPGYFFKYDKSHPERLRRMIAYKARNEKEYIALTEYFFNPDFRKYVDDPPIGDEALACHVDLYTQYENFHGL